MNDKLIYDVGMYDGADTAYYLYRGYSVVAIEASPILAAKAQQRFARAIQQGRLTILNIGISEKSGTTTFWVNQDNDEWSAFDRERASRENTTCYPVSVECVPFAKILGEYGVPYYLKMDIEGNDIWCIRALDPHDLPRFVSVEFHNLECLCHLYALGYRGFKIVNQNFVWKTSPVARWRFPHGSSGAFGNDTAGAWEPIEVVTYDLLHELLGYPRRSSLYDGWYDIHATMEPPSTACLHARAPLRARRLWRGWQIIEAFYRRFLYRSSF
jgi:FkbM family methyltransferase